MHRRLAPAPFASLRSCALLASLLLLAAVAPPRAEAGRARDCPHQAGDLPVATLPDGTPHGSQIPIDHIIVLMQENRSFDHMLGQLHNEGQPNADGQSGLEANPLSNGSLLRTFHQTRVCEVADLSHSWNATHKEFAGGTMSGFAKANEVAADPTGSRAMGHLTSQEIPFYYALYSTFAMADKYFAAVLGPTYPNRFFLMAGTSFGRISNELPSRTEYGPSVFDLLLAAGVPWKIYYNDIPFDAFFLAARQHPDRTVLMDQFFADVAADALPPVAFINPAFFGEESDEHPPSNVQMGQAFVAGVIDALMHSPSWAHSALFLTYDEHGGYYDHVVPPSACIPDATPPRLGPGDFQAAFDRDGIRVPMAVVSPYAKPHYVSHTNHDHTSILRFIETRFDLPALTARDANALPPLEMFDFVNPPAFLVPPALPEAVVDPDRAAADCPAP